LLQVLNEPEDHIEGFLPKIKRNKACKLVEN
jgi:hypothetical protein